MRILSTPTLRSFGSVVLSGALFLPFPLLFGDVAAEAHTGVMVEVQLPDTLEELAEKASRAVVLIDVRTASDKRQGSGFLVDPSGRILTNEHVIRDARTLRVKLASGDVYDAVSILAADERRDIAVLQVAGFDLPSLTLANSDSVRVGNPVILIGSPLGLENTVTTGIVSGRRHEPEGYHLLQVSAPASPGSSGGPVLTRTGDVVGIAASQMRTGQNLNFAVPINYARGLLSHLDGQPLAVLGPTGPMTEGATVPLAAEENSANAGLYFNLDDFGGYSVELEVSDQEDRVRRTRITYQYIETIGNGDPRIERYLESETTRRTGPFATQQTVRRERTRTIIDAAGLRPVSTHGEIARWTGDDWARAEYDLRFDDYRVTGSVRDTTGHREELDRELPRGVILREVLDLAFASLAVDSLVGRSVEFVTFDPFTGTVLSDRYDVRDETDVQVAGKKYKAFRVNVASGLNNTTAFFKSDRPRILLRRQGVDSEESEDLTRVEVFPARPRNR